MASAAAQRLRVGVIGAGANTRKMHLPGLRAVPGVEVTQVVNRSAASSQAAAAELGIPHAAESWNALVTSPEIDAVMIGTWPYTHCEMTIAALKADKHVLCEARMATDAREAREMLAAARARPHLTAQIVPSPFTLPYDATIAALVRGGRLGDVLAISVRGVGSGFVDTAAPLHWRQDKVLSGNNIMMMGIFYEAMMRWVGGAARVMAMAKTNVKKRERDGVAVDVSVPDHLDVIAEMECGAQAHMQFSAVTGLAERTMEFWLYGSEGTVHLDVTSATPLRFGTRGGSLDPLAVREEDAQKWRVEEEFVAAIRGEEQVKLTTLADGVKYMEFTDAVTRSLETGAAAAVAPLDPKM